MAKYFVYEDEDDCFIVEFIAEGIYAGTFEGKVIKIIRGNVYNKGFISNRFYYRSMLYCDINGENRTTIKPASIYCE